MSLPVSLLNTRIVNEPCMSLSISHFFERSLFFSSEPQAIQAAKNKSLQKKYRNSAVLAYVAKI